jgi:periplasmic protein CpxP/Spy
MNHNREVTMKSLNRIQKTALAVVMALAVAVPIVTAQSTDEGGKRGRSEWRGQGRRGDGHMRGFRNLDLTDAQKAQIKQIHESSRESLRPITEQIRAKRQEIRQASQGGSFNEALVSQKLAEIAPLEAKLMGERFRIHQATLAVLTPEQKAKLEQSREEFKEKRAEQRANKQQKTR